MAKGDDPRNRRERREDPEGEGLEAWSQMFEQANAAAVDLAGMHARYYLELVKQGVPARQAATITAGLASAAGTEE